MAADLRPSAAPKPRATKRSKAAAGDGDNGDGEDPSAAARACLEAAAAALPPPAAVPAALGVRTMGLGYAAHGGWSGDEETLFSLGYAKHLREFAELRDEFLPQRSVAQLVGYYYNVYKLRHGSKSLQPAQPEGEAAAADGPDAAMHAAA